MSAPAEQLVALSASRPVPAAPDGARAREAFGERGFEVALALAEAVLPRGFALPGASAATLDRLASVLGGFGTRSIQQYRKLLELLDYSAVVRYGKRFSRLDPARRAEFLWRWHGGGHARHGLFIALTYPLKNAHFDDRRVYQTLGCIWENPPVNDPTPRTMQQVTAADDLPEGEEIECDVVVVGTGAGGAVVAKELAERGVAVLMLEEGRYFSRKDFIRRSLPATRQLYKNGGLTGVVGNCVIPIPLGKSVGGSTTINTGTCLRAPDWILERWRTEHGLDAFTPDTLGRFYDKVESILEVAPSSAAAVGAPAEVVRRGAEKLGWKHFAVPRNAPGCDGQGVCQWGCPTDAKRSMNISYVPLALSRGAQLVTGVRVHEVIVENGRAVGVRGASASGQTLSVRARGVILACGSLATPVMLLKQGLANESGQVGRNLTIHPATSVSAVFDEDIRGFNRVPQGYGVDEFHREGMLILGAGAPLDMGANMFPFVGERYMSLMSRYDRIASFGVMVEDGPNGRVLLGPGGKPLMLYRLGKHERRLLARGSAAVARIFQAAGARQIYTEVRGHEELETTGDIERLENACPGGFDVVMVAFHPLGTCRMGIDPMKSVVDPYHETHDVPGLYIVDGSVVPTSIAVNTQLTIMALATRAAELIAPRFA
jgi:choline dehydrogenase-like flavoprotein